MADGNPMDALMEVFMVETNDFLSKIEDILIQGEKAEDGIRQATPEIFRIMHTIKSSSAMMSLDNISKLTHRVEDLFYYLRENKPEKVDDSKLIDIVLEAVDFIKRNLDGTAREDSSAQIEKVSRYLDELKAGGASAQPAPEKAPAAEKPAARSPAAAPVVEPVPAPAAPASQPAPAPAEGIALRVRFKQDCQMLGLRSLEVLNRVRAAVDSLESAPEDPSTAEADVQAQGLLLRVRTGKPIDEIIALIRKSPFVDAVETADAEAAQAAPVAEPPGMPVLTITPQAEVTAPAMPVQPAAPMQEAPPAAPAAPAQPVEEPVRQFVERRRDSTAFGKAYANVEITKLDYLVDLVGEILMLQMELAQDIDKQDFKKGEATVDKLKKMVLVLQEATLSTRMVPVKDTFLKMNRLVRDMCRRQDKDISFVTSGEETEVDRSIIENISSPLMHIIRNSIDHGIEPAEERIAAGKPEQGRVELTAYTEGRNVVIAVTDDGKGFDAERILAKAVGNGMVTEAQGALMSIEEIHALAFLPGFSTNEDVTEYSGRGVGMDVVNENLKKMNGKVIVHSEQGVGTRIVLKIPLTLAIIDTIVLRVGGETCAIPVSFVNKIVFMGENDSVRTVNGEDVVLLKDECYKILNLFDFYTFAERIPYEDGIMIIIGDVTKQYVVFANEIVDRQDVVVKPAPPLFKTIRGISGCTVLGDGSISLILDTDELLASQNKKRSAQS